METKHISWLSASDRTVELICKTELHNDKYHNSIKYAAKTLLSTLNLCQRSKARCPNYAIYQYRTQYENGATVWRHPLTEVTVLVDLNGNIDDEFFEGAK